MLSKEDVFTVQQLCLRAGIPRSTLRVYERAGLIEPDRRTASGYRLYSDGAVRRLKAIRAARGLGFSLTEIGAFLSVSPSHAGESQPLHLLLERRIDDLGQRIARLHALQDALRRLQSDASQRAASMPDAEHLLVEVLSGFPAVPEQDPDLESMAA